MKSLTENQASTGSPCFSYGEKLDDVRTQRESDVRYANITIIEGHDASQYGIGIVSTRIAEMILGDERAAIPIAEHDDELGPSINSNLAF
jgi:L-lactate dehydrogenase